VQLGAQHRHSLSVDAAANPIATALAPYYVKGENLVRAAFLDPRVRDMHGNWEHVTQPTQDSGWPTARVGIGRTSVRLAPALEVENARDRR
jgi:hypothetical protein